MVLISSKNITPEDAKVEIMIPLSVWERRWAGEICQGPQGISEVEKGVSHVSSVLARLYSILVIYFEVT